MVAPKKPAVKTPLSMVEIVMRADAETIAAALEARRKVDACWRNALQLMNVLPPWKNRLTTSWVSPTLLSSRHPQYLWLLSLPPPLQLLPRAFLHQQPKLKRWKSQAKKLLKKHRLRKHTQLDVTAKTAKLRRSVLSFS